MARVTKKKEEKKEVEVKTLTRAEKKNATQALIKDVLRVNPHKHNDLIDEVSKLYAQKFGGEDTENINDVKGRVGSVLDLMKKEGEVLYEGGRYALKDENSSKMPTPEVEEKAKKPTRTKAKKAEKKEEISAIQEEKTEEQPPVEEKKVEKKATKKQTKKSAKALEIKEEKVVDVLEKESENATIAPVEQTAEVVLEVVAEKSEAVAENASKKEKKKPTRAKAKKVVEKQNEAPTVALKEENLPVKEENTAQVEIKNPPVVKEKAELAQKNVVDMSFLFGNVKPKTEKTEKTEKAEKIEKAIPTEKEEKIDKVEITIEPKKEEKILSEKVEEKEVLAEEKTPEKQIEKQEIKQEKAPEKQENKHPMRRPATRENVKNIRKLPEKPMTADERLREAYLKRLRALGGDYFEYYSVYLLERYSMKNGRRLEGLRISGGDHDGGIDGEIELTDRFGFKETIYIQSKNWDPEKGKEEYWVVGETLLQQFIGACACRQAKDGKQHCRGIFVTTSRFTPEAKRILEAMSDKIVGYDGTDLYEAAKECKFGLVYENGNWKLDEKLLSGVKAFFSMM